MCAKSTFNTISMLSNNKAEFKYIDLKRDKYLTSLGLTTNQGEIRERKRSKIMQIDNFIEIVLKELKISKLANQKDLSIIDMASGKGYLTFALYDYLKNVLNINVNLSGIERKKEYVDECNQIAQKNNYKNLTFYENNIEDFEVKKIDIVIALHACDTATDDAIVKGIKAQAELIFIIPCCQRELRKKIKVPVHLQPILRYPTLLEREIEILTDSIRALFLESKSYKVKVFEFIALEHTGRNIMIIGNKSQNNINEKNFSEKIEQLKFDFKIKELYLQKIF